MLRPWKNEYLKLKLNWQYIEIINNYQTLNLLSGGIRCSLLPAWAIVWKQRDQKTRIIICHAHLLANLLTIPLMYNLIVWNNFLEKKIWLVQKVFVYSCRLDIRPQIGVQNSSWTQLNFLWNRHIKHLVSFLLSRVSSRPQIICPRDGYLLELGLIHLQIYKGKFVSLANLEMRPWFTETPKNTK